MMVLVSYDVATTDDGGPRRLRRVAKACKDGLHVGYFAVESPPPSTTHQLYALLRVAPSGLAS